MKHHFIYEMSGGAPVSAVLLLTIGISSLYGFYHPRYFLSMILHPFGIVRQREYYRLFTSDLIHNDFGHVLMNGCLFYVVCFNMEQNLNRESVYGSLVFLTIYFVSYCTGVLICTIRHRNDFSYSSAGASGSIMGCMMGFMLLKPDKIALFLPVVGGVKNSMMALLFIIILTVYQYRTNNKLMNNELHFFSALGGIGATVVMFPDTVV